MKVTPVGKSFGKYKIGDEFELADKAANVFVKAGKLRKVEPIAGYQTRMMSVSAPVNLEQANYGYKTDGTPRKRPGRPAASA
jgi:hypothetical protein